MISLPMATTLQDDPFNYDRLTPWAPPEVTTFNMTRDPRTGKFKAEKSDDNRPEALPAEHPHLHGIERGEWWAVVTVDGLFGPYRTLAAAQSVIVDGLAPGGQVHPMTHP